MQTSKIVLISFPYDQGDILKDFLEWHLDLGVDLIVAMDFGSTDGSRDVLEGYSRAGRVAWLPTPGRDMSEYALADILAGIARDQHGAEWIVHCDADEFLCTRGPDLKTVLAEASRDGVTLLDLPRRNMTGAPLQAGQRATKALTLRIEGRLSTTHEQHLSGELPFPTIFNDTPGHLAVRADALIDYGAGAHTATVRWGVRRTSDQLYILHYPIRGYETFQTKVDNVTAWLADNPRLPPTWGWHWRRLIRLRDEGRLREEYEQQFVSPERAEELIRDGVCVVDESIAAWLARKT